MLQAASASVTESHERNPRDRVRGLMYLAFAIAAGLVVAWIIRNALLIIYVSAVFAVVLKPFVDWLHGASILGWHPGRGTALLVLFLLFIVAFSACIAVAVPSIVSSIGDLGHRLIDHSDELQERIKSVPFLKSINLAELPAQISNVLARVVAAIGNGTANILAGLLLSAYFILDGAALVKQTMRVLPPERRERFAATLYRAGRRMRNWLVGQVMLMAILGGAAAVTFGLMGLPYFYLLALFAGVANIVPLLGPLATVAVAGAVALTQSGWDALGVLIFYLVYQQVENAFLTPHIMKAQVELSSSVVIIALLVGSELAGIAGALVAVPTAVLIAEFANEYLVQHTASQAPGG